MIKNFELRQIMHQVQGLMSQLECGVKVNKLTQTSNTCDSCKANPLKQIPFKQIPLNRYLIPIAMWCVCMCMCVCVCVCVCVCECECVCVCECVGVCESVSVSLCGSGRVWERVREGV